MTDTPVFRPLLRTVLAAIVALVVVALFTSGVAATQPGTVKRIHIDPAIGTIAVSGAITRGNTSAYAIAPGAGRNLTIGVTSPEDNARISIAGPDGVWIASVLTGAETVTTDGDYTIVVSSGSGRANYKVAVAVT